jgi:hypothetical protein
LVSCQHHNNTDKLTRLDIKKKLGKLFIFWYR